MSTMRMASTSTVRMTSTASAQLRIDTVLDVDLAGVTFLDCTGIGALVVVRNDTVHIGRQMWVATPSPSSPGTGSDQMWVTPQPIVAGYWKRLDCAGVPTSTRRPKAGDGAA